MEVDAKGYEEKPWWPYVLDLQEKIDAGGGGGGGDFSKATVTFSSTQTGMLQQSFPEIVEGNPDEEVCIMTGILMLVSVKPPEKVIVPLYKGKCIIMPVNENYTVSGNCNTDDGRFIISGDCTITYHA